MNQARLYCILDLGYTTEAQAEAVTAALLEGGADVLQLRAKNHDRQTIQRVAEKLIPLCKSAGIPFILNDFPDLAASLDASGVHIGQDDGALSDARAVMGPGKWIGRSTHSIAQACAALEEGFDYIGFGPLFPTPTKAGRAAIGLEEISTMEQEVGRHIPAFCIGGITPVTLPQVMAADAKRIVVVSALLQAHDVAAATRAIRTQLGNP